MSTVRARTPIHADQPKAGWYRYRKVKDGPWEACAIFKKGDRLVCVVGMGTKRRNEDPAKIWTWVAHQSVSKEAAQHAFEKGFWPDQPDPQAVRSNLPEDPFERLLALVEDKRAQAETWLNSRPAIMQKVDADLASNMRDGLLDLVKQADVLFKAEKAPLIKAADACDEKYRFRDVVKGLADQLREVFGRWMAGEQRRLDREAASKHKAAVERVEAERAKLKEDDPVAFHTGSAPELPLGPAPTPKVQVGGGVSRKMGLKKVWLPKIVDYKQAASHVIEHPDVRKVVEKLIAHMVKDAKGSIQIPGVEIIEDRVAA